MTEPPLFGVSSSMLLQRPLLDAVAFARRAGLNGFEVWADHPQRTGQFGWRFKWRQILRGTVAVQKRFRTSLLDINPILWLASRERQVAFNRSIQAVLSKFPPPESWRNFSA